MKYFKWLGAMALAIAPIQLVMACTPAKSSILEEDREGVSTIDKSIPKIKTIGEEISADKLELQKIESDKNFEEGLYISKKYYSGTIYSPKKQFSKKENTAWEVANHNLVKIPEASGYGRDQSVIQLQKDDSIFMIYNEDDNDGLKPDNFTDEVTFNDSSIMISKQIKDINLSIGSVREIEGQWGNIYDIKFTPQSDKDGYLSKYIGSQSNHSDITFTEAMANIKAELSPARYEMIVNYYKTASQSFVPFIMGERTFKYTKISERIYQITYVGDKPITAARFRVTNENNEGTTFGTYSINKKDWASYETSSNNYFFLARGVINYSDEVHSISLSQQPLIKGLHSLPKETYNNIVDDLAKKDNYFQIAVIADDKAYFQQFAINGNDTLWDYMTRMSKIKFKSSSDKLMGKWVGPYYEIDHPNIILKGQSKNSNYGLQGYPLFLYNHKYANLGVSNFHPKAGNIVEISYNHNS